MNEIDNQLSNSHSEILNSEYPNFLRLYQVGQLHVAKGNYNDAKETFKAAMEEIQPVKEDFVWKRIFENLGTNYALVLDYLGMVEEADLVFSELLSRFPTGIFIGDYAVFLHRRKRDFAQAEAFYRKSIEKYPFQSSIRVKYAGFLRHVRKDMVEAEMQYRLAVDSNPQSAEALGSYASFLHGVKGQKDLAEAHYERAVKADMTHANNLCNYGLFLSEEKRNYARAEELYRAALQLSPKHANTLYNYGVMLDTHLKRKSDAESLYRRCIQLEPQHSFALYNLAVLLEEKVSQRKKALVDPSTSDVAGIESDFAEVGTFYQRSLEADPRDATTAADLGRFLLNKMNDAAGAESALQTALNLDPRSEVALYNMAVLMHMKRQESEAAEVLFRRVIGVNPGHIAALHQLARLLAERIRKHVADEKKTMPVGNIDEILALYEKTISLQQEPTATIHEYLKVVVNIGENKHKLRAISTLDAAVRTRGVDKSHPDLARMVESLKV